jgi:hypothetical protein
VDRQYLRQLRASADDATSKRSPEASTASRMRER